MRGFEEIRVFDLTGSTSSSSGDESPVYLANKREIRKGNLDDDTDSSTSAEILGDEGKGKSKAKHECSMRNSSIVSYLRTATKKSKEEEKRQKNPKSKTPSKSKEKLSKSLNRWNSILSDFYLISR